MHVDNSATNSRVQRPQTRIRSDRGIRLRLTQVASKRIAAGLHIPVAVCLPRTHAFPAGGKQECIAVGVASGMCVPDRRPPDDVTNYDVTVCDVIPSRFLYKKGA